MPLILIGLTWLLTYLSYVTWVTKHDGQETRVKNAAGLKVFRV